MSTLHVSKDRTDVVSAPMEFRVKGRCHNAIKSVIMINFMKQNNNKNQSALRNQQGPAVVNEIDVCLLCSSMG